MPTIVNDEFKKWAIFAQARPALVQILQKSGLDSYADALALADSYASLARLSDQAAQEAHTTRKKTGPLGMSTAETAAFLMSKMARVALDEDADINRIAVVAAQICGLLGFAQTGFTNTRRKQEAEAAAAQMQRQKLQRLYNAYLQEEETNPPHNRAQISRKRR